MKYMHFNMSCSYAALANLLEEFEVEVDDFEIVKTINLPYVFQYSYEEGGYIAGPLLQGKKWFDYYLHPLGMTFIEALYDKENTLKFLDEATTKCMLGLNLGNRHAVIYEGQENSMYKFLNMKRVTDDSPDYYFFTKDEVAELLNSQNSIGYITHQEISEFKDNQQDIISSLHYLECYQKELSDFCYQEQSPQNLKDTMNKLFAASLLHILSMMELIGETELANEFCEIRNQYMNAIKQSQTLKLIEYIDYPRFIKALNNYKYIVANFIDSITSN